MGKSGGGLLHEDEAELMKADTRGVESSNEALAMASRDKKSSATARQRPDT